MNDKLISRLEALDSLKKIPHAELKWLADHGKYEVYPPGLMMSKGTPAEFMWIILVGQISLHVDSGAGPKVANTELKQGVVTGLLPYSRLKVIPGDLYADEKTEVLSISADHIPEIIIVCPHFTSHTVHLMIDRTRIYNTSAMQDEKMLSLGKISAGLAHELNNPASVVSRNIKLLRASRIEADNTLQSLIEAGLTKEQFRAIRAFYAELEGNSDRPNLSPLQKMDLEENISAWLEQYQADTQLAGPLAEMGIRKEDLGKLEKELPANILTPALHWIVTGFDINKLNSEAEQSAAKIHGLVEAVKEFTSMDNLAEKELVDIGSGIRNTVKMLDAKIKAKSARIALDLAQTVPGIYGNGAALNQVWFSLLDNALDAIPVSGNISIQAILKSGQVLIRFIDNGPGISSDIRDKIFDPFFSTKQPGQGIGLGLDLSRRIIRRHNGDISVRCGEDRTEFCVNLMLKRP